MKDMMRAFVVHAPGNPDALKLEERETPEPRFGDVRIEVKAFGLNRAELLTRAGLSPSVTLPRILGIEAVGVVDACPSGVFAPGQVVATAMGGMGRSFDGSYAEFTTVPEQQVQALETSLPWSTLAALPEMTQTAFGALYRGIAFSPGDTILIRGGTSSVGLMASLIAREHGCTVISTTRNEDRITTLKKYGAHHAIVDNGTIADRVRKYRRDGVDAVLDLVGTRVLQDNLEALREGGTLCLAGILGGEWALQNFSPMFDLPSKKRLVAYVGDANDFMRTPLQDIADMVARDEIAPPIARTLPFESLPDAHREMEANAIPGKWVMTI